MQNYFALSDSAGCSDSISKDGCKSAVIAQLLGTRSYHAKILSSNPTLPFYFIDLNSHLIAL